MFGAVIQNPNSSFGLHSKQSLALDDLLMLRNQDDQKDMDLGFWKMFLWIELNLDQDIFHRNSLMSLNL